MGEKINSRQYAAIPAAFRRVQRRALVGAMQDSGRQAARMTHYFAARRFSIASISMPVIEIGNAASISRAQVGLVTLISVRRSPITSRPTKISPSFSVGATARAIFQSLSLSGRASPRRRPPGCHGSHPAPECAPGSKAPARRQRPECVCRRPDRRQEVLRHAETAAVFGQGFDDHRQVRIVLLHAEDRRAAHAVQRFQDDVAVLLVEFADVRGAAADQRVRRQFREPGGEQLSLQSRRLCGLLTTSVPLTSARSRM